MLETHEPPHAASRTRRVVTLALWVVLVLALPLAALTLNVAKVAGFPLGYWITAQGALLGLAVLAFVTSRSRAGPAGPRIWGAAVTLAASGAGAVLLLAAPSAVVMRGYDGLPIALGMVAGFALLAQWIAPRFDREFAGRTADRPLAALFSGNGPPSLFPSLVSALFIAIAAAFLLAAELRGAGLALAGLTGSAPGVVSLAVAAALFAFIGALPARLASPLRIAGLLVTVAFGSLALVAIAGVAASQPYPHLGLGYALQELADVDQKLIMDKLADFSALRPMASPFLQVSMLNFAGLTLAVAFGVAVAPQLIAALRAPSPQSADSVDQIARRSGQAARATLLVALLALSAAPLAVYSRLGFERTLTAGIPQAEMPTALVDAASQDLVTVCGSNASDPELLSEACAKAPGQRGRLRLQDVHYSGDGFLIAAPRLSGIGSAGAALFPLSVLIASALAAGALLASLAATAPPSRGPGSTSPFAAVAWPAIALAAAVALALSGLDVAALGLSGLAILAAGVFPALLLTLLWPAFSNTAAAATTLVGSGLATVYVVGSQLAPGPFFAATATLSSADDAAIRKFDLLNAALDRAASPQAQANAAAALDRHVAGIANWWGLEPAAIVLVALPLACLVGATFAVAASTTRRPVSS